VRIHQLTAALSYGDAIGNEALAIQRQLRAAGHESEIFAELVHPRVAHLARPLFEYARVSSPETVCIFHFSIGSAAGRLIHHAPDRLVVVGVAQRAIREQRVAAAGPIAAEVGVDLRQASRDAGDDAWIIEQSSKITRLVQRANRGVVIPAAAQGLRESIQDPAALGRAGRPDFTKRALERVNCPGEIVGGQMKVADRLVLSKGDIASPEAVSALRSRLRRLNPLAPMIEAVMGGVEPGWIFGSGDFDIAEKSAEVRSWLEAEACVTDHERGDHGHAHGEDPDPNRHDSRIRAYCLTFQEPLDWDIAAEWLDRLAIDHGENLLRVKGLLNVHGQDEPVVIQGVHHLFHPPSTLPAWPDADRRSRLVFIVRDLARQHIEAGAPSAH